MRASDVRQIIVDALEAIQPDHDSGRHDRFRHDPHAFGGGAPAPDRTFAIVLDTPPYHGGDMTDGRYLVGYAVIIQYGIDASILERIEQDSERVVDALLTISRDHDAPLDVLSTELIADTELNALEMQIQVRVSYSLDIF